MDVTVFVSLLVTWDRQHKQKEILECMAFMQTALSVMIVTVYPEIIDRSYLRLGKETCRLQVSPDVTLIFRR